MINPLIVIKEAIQQVPALRYGLGVAGLGAVLSLVVQFAGGNIWEGLIGVGFVLILMLLLFLFAVFIEVGGPARVAAIVLVWAFLILIVITSVLAITVTFWDYPRDLSGLLRDFGSEPPASEVLITDFDKDCLRSDFTCLLSFYVHNNSDEPLTLNRLLLRSESSRPVGPGSLGRPVESYATAALDISSLTEDHDGLWSRLDRVLDAGESARITKCVQARARPEDQHKEWELTGEVSTSHGVLQLPNSVTVVLPWNSPVQSAKPIGDISETDRCIDG